MMKRPFVLLVLLCLLLTTSCANPLGTIPGTAPTEPSPSQSAQTPTPPPTTAPVMLPGLSDTLPEPISASYHLTTERDTYLLNVIYRNEDGTRYSVTREGAYTECDGLYTLSTADGPLYGRYVNGTFYLTDETGQSPLPSSLRGGSGVSEIAITPAAGNRADGYFDLANHPGGDRMQTLYRDMLAACETFAASTETVTDTNHAIAVLDYAALSLSKDEAIAVWKIFTLENPAYYWLSTSVYTSSSHLYLCIDPLYEAPAARRSADADIRTMIEAVRARITDDMRELEIALILHDFILERVDYAYIAGTKQPETAIWAHNVVGASTMGAGVCETYAKTFHFLGTILGLDVLTVSGDVGEPHAWNLVCIEGEWYGVDLTWDDTKEKTHAYTHFGMGADQLEKEHTADTPYATGGGYLYALPTVSERDIALVTLYENGISLGVYAGIDDAMRAMTNADADYRIDLYNYAYEGAHLNTYPALRHAILADKTPAVKSITITGGHLAMDRYREQTALYFYNVDGFTLQCDLSVENAALTSELSSMSTLRLQGYTLTFTGESGACHIALIGEQDAVISVKTVDETILHAYTRVASVGVRSGSTLVLAGGAEIETVEGADLRLAPDDVGAGADYHVSRLMGSAQINLLLSDGAKLNLGRATARVLEVELAFEDERTFPTLVFTEAPKAQVSILVDGNVNEATVATPINLARPIATLPQGTSMDILDVSFAVWYSGGGVIVNRDFLFEIKDDGKLQTIDYNIVENDFVVYGDILLLYIGDDASVTVPSMVREIYPAAFLGLDRLERVTLGEGVEIIQPSAFLRCPNLKEIDLPNTLSRFSATFAGALANAVLIRYNGTLTELYALLQKNGISAVSGAFTFVCKDGTL